MVDGNPVDHPIVELNLLAIEPEFDGVNVPAGYSEFVRVERPSFGVYETATHHGYKIEGNIVTDDWRVTTLSNSEKEYIINNIKSNWEQNPTSPKSWIFNEGTCSYVPPTAKPQDGKTYWWRESDTSWVHVPEKPSDTSQGTYVFNIETENWEIL